MKTIIAVENIKCHGCANTIKNNLERIEGVDKATVVVDNQEVEVVYDALQVTLKTIVDKLKKLGYPEAGKNNGLHRVKSYVSCAIGRI